MSSDQSLSGLASTLENVQRNMKDESERNTGYFKRTMERLDALPAIQTDVAVMKESLSNLKSSFSDHKTEDRKGFDDLTEQIDDLNTGPIEELKKDKWVRHGQAGAVGAITGAIAGIAVAIIGKH